MFDEMWQEIADAVIGYDDLTDGITLDPNYDF